MATLNLGRIKPVFRGAYSGSTAYVVDDIVTHADETYICIQAHGAGTQAVTQTAYWTKMAAKGSDGTDVGATLNNKEIAFKTNAGAVDGIPIGSANQFLKVNSGATGYEFGAVSSDFVRIVTAAGDGTAVLDLDSCFSAAYENYRIIANIHVSSTTNAYVRLQNSSNSEIQTGYYYVGTQNYKSSSGQGTDVKTGWNSNTWSPQESISAEVDGYGSIILDVARPFVSGRTTAMHIRYTSYDGGAFRQVDSYCQERGTDTNAGIRLYVTSGNITSLSSISVYGIKNS